jgi:hypothetical protein
MAEESVPREAINRLKSLITKYGMREPDMTKPKATKMFSINREVPGAFGDALQSQLEFYIQAAKSVDAAVDPESFRLIRNLDDRSSSLPYKAIVDVYPVMR